MTRLAVRRRIATAAAVAMLSAAGLLYRFTPAKYGFYPACPIHAATGLLCPGCGATRALAALLHGRLAEAWHSNVLFVLWLPLLAIFTAESLRRALTRKDFFWPRPPVYALYLLGLVTAVFSIVRNLR